MRAEDGLIVDSFAGGGGASTGIEWALGRSPDIAINHDASALAMHEANHPATVHLTENIWRVNPLAVTRGKPVFLLHASPDCRHHSKAKGGKPVSRSVRGLADVVLVWAREVHPQVITLENVEEFADWGPLDAGDRPCPERKGQEFRRWVRCLEDEGYAVAWWELRACDYGAPTIRKRLFLVARRDRKPILKPAPTHGDPRSEAVKSGALKPWRTAAEIIDWSLPCPSIFLTRAAARQAGLRVIRPLADKTLARIARGFKRYVLDRPAPFIVSYYGDGAGGTNRFSPADEPSRTVTTENRFGIVTPFLSYAQQGGASRPADAPHHTICANAKDQNQVIAPFLAVNRFGATGKAADTPLPTITANSFIKRPGAGGPLSIVAPHLMTMRNSGKPFTEADAPAHTITAGGAGLSHVAAFLVPRYGEAAGQAPRARPLDEPAPTIVPTGNGGGLSAVYLAQHNGNGVIGRDAAEPLSTATTSGANQQPVMGYLARLQGDCTGEASDAPLGTVLAAGGHHAVVSAPFMAAYYGTGDGAACDDPCRTTTTRDRFALVDCAAGAPPFDEAKAATAREVAAFLKAQGAWSGNADGSTEFVMVGPYIVYDIGMRMLTPRELASAQGFPLDYVLAAPFNGGVLSETEQRHKIGNSVCPHVEAAVIRANCVDALALPDVKRKRARLPPPQPDLQPVLFAGA